jgi:hypothetical protein
MYYYEQDGLSGLGRSFKSAVKKLNPVAVAKKTVAVVQKVNPVAVAKKTVAVTKKVTVATVINPTRAMMTTASPKSLLTAGRRGGIMGVLGTAVSAVRPSKPEQAEQVVEPASVMDGPLVNIYATDGSEGQIPNNYLVNGTFTDETGMVWSTKNPATEAAVENIDSFVNAVTRPAYNPNSKYPWRNNAGPNKGHFGRGQMFVEPKTTVMSAPVVSAPTVMSAPAVSAPTVMSAPAVSAPTVMSAPVESQMVSYSDAAETSASPIAIIPQRRGFIYMLSELMRARIGVG